MKTIKLFLKSIIILAGVLFAVTGCKKKDDVEIGRAHV
jgi:hypothetical protein